MRVSILALVSCLVFAGMLADRVPPPRKPTRTMVAREALHGAREAGESAVAACVAYALSPEASDRWLIQACAELLRTGSVPDDIREVPVYDKPDRPGITL